MFTSNTTLLFIITISILLCFGNAHYEKLIFPNECLVLNALCTFQYNFFKNLEVRWTFPSTTNILTSNLH